MSAGSTAAENPAQAKLPVPAVSPAEAARVLRQQRARRLVTNLVVWVFSPTLLAALYIGFIASPEYESEASFLLRGADAATDAAMLRDFVRSRAVLKELNRGGQLRAHYEENGDVLSQLSKGAGEEALHGYFQSKVSTSYESHGGVLTFRVKAFSGKAAHAYNLALLELSQRLLRDMGIEQREARIAKSERVLSEQRAELLRAQRALMELELAADASASVEQRAAIETAKLDKTLAEQSYDSAHIARESARSEGNKHTRVVTLSEPSEPDLAAYPRRIHGVLTTFFTALALFGIGKLLMAAVREHGQF